MKCCSKIYIPVTVVICLRVMSTGVVGNKLFVTGDPGETREVPTIAVCHWRDTLWDVETTPYELDAMEPRL